MTYVTNLGGIRVPMTASNYLVEFDSDFVGRVRDRKYFQIDDPRFTKVGLGLLTKGQHI